MAKSKTSCANCADWEPFDKDTAEYFRTFKGMDKGDWVRCGRGYSAYGEPSDPEFGAYAYDGDECGGTLHTSSDFGCVRFREKIG